MDLKIDVSNIEDMPVLELQGEVDVYTTPRVRSRLTDLVDQGNFKIVVDLEGVDFMDSSGLGVLVGGLRRVKPRDGGIALVCTKEKILRIFKITGLNKIFPIFSDRAEAVAALK